MAGLKAKAAKAMESHFGPLDSVAAGDVDSATILERVLAIGVIAMIAIWGSDA
jgi:hypothetical protein